MTMLFPFAGFSFSYLNIQWKMKNGTFVQVFLALRFFATGSFQREDGDLHEVSQSCVSRVIHKVFKSIAELKPRYIKFPASEEYQGIQEEFYAEKGFPEVLGAIECTHIPIGSPGGEDAELYRNRKGWFSLNVQLVCDSKLLIRNVIASWKGSMHDSRIFNESMLKDELEKLPGRFHLLGDRGYPCLRYLMTPLPNPQTPSEHQYNYAYSSTGMVIERVNGILKRRFPCLSNLLRYKSEKCAVIIVACCVLHNYSRCQGDLLTEDQEIETQEADQVGENVIENPAGLAKRRAIISEYF